MLPSATYGLLGIGWSSSGFARMHGMCMKQLRLIARSPVHLTSETNVSLMQRLGMQELGAHFELMTTNALAYHRQLEDDLRSEDIMCRPIYVSWYRQLLQDMQTSRTAFMTAPEHFPSDLRSTHACEFCDQTFDDVRSLRIHQRKSHGEDLPEDWNRSQITLETVRMHAADGMPTCAYCLFKFANWRNLYEHLLQSRCKILTAHATYAALPAGTSAVQPWVQNSDLIQSIRTSGLGVLRRSSSSLQELQHHCCLCRQWFVHPDYAASHYKKTHGVLWEALGNRVRALVRPISLSAACSYCGKVPTRKAKHRCPVLTQAYFALLVDERRAGGCPADESRNQLLSESLPSALSDAERTDRADGYKGPAKTRDTSTREESLSKAMKGEIHDGVNSPREPVGARASASQSPAKVSMMSLPTPPSTTASPASTLTPQQQLLPNAATATPSGKGKTKKGKQGKGQGKGQKGGSDPSQTTSGSSHQDNVISAMGRLCLRHEDAIAVQRANQGYVWWLRTAGPESIVPSLARVSAAWNRKKDEEGIQDHPLRIVMLSTLLEVMIERAQAAVEPSRLEASAQAGLILNQGDEPFWPFLRWNPARHIEEVMSSEEMRPRKHSRLMRKLNQIRDTINPENILRCHGYRSISENMTGDTWRLLLEIETVGEEAQNLHAWLRRMINCTAWKLIGGRFRRERLGRSPLANRLAELLG